MKFNVCFTLNIDINDSRLETIIKAFSSVVPTLFQTFTGQVLLSMAGRNGTFQAQTDL